MPPLPVTIILLMLTGWVLGTTTPEPDPCHESGHKILKDTWRSPSFEVVYPAKPRCDSRLVPGWYRFDSGAGDTIPTTCPKMFTCGTYVPLWMNGTLPSVAEGKVVRQICGHFLSGRTQGDSCCDGSVDIDVKNCGTFFVYYLIPPPSCPVAYCAEGGKAPCPVGKWSVDGFAPCHDAYPYLEIPPKLHGPRIHGSSFDFECEITFDKSHPDQVFEVKWTFDGAEDVNAPIQNLTDPSRTATLNGSLLRNHINSKLDCRVRAFYRGNQKIKTDWFISNSFYLGIQVSPPTLILSEGDFKENVTVISSIPVICNHHKGTCCLTFTLDFDQTNQVLVPNNCAYEMCNHNWDQKLKQARTIIPVVANQDFKDDGETHLLMKFEELAPAFGGPYMDVFYGHQLDAIRVTVKDEKTSLCKIYSDPHIMSFDGRRYSLFLLGDFIAYDVPDRNFQIQIRTWACSHATCVCGLVIREDNDIIQIDHCDQEYSGPHVSPTIEIGRADLREGVAISRSRDGAIIGVYLLSGTQIKVECRRNHLSLYITGPGFDRNKTQGLCGTYDGDSNNDLTYPDRTVETSKSKSALDNFFRAWMANGSKSLFNEFPDLLPVNDTFRYCICNNHDSTVNCSQISNVEQNSLYCKNCSQVKPRAGRSTFKFNGRKKRNAVYSDVDTTDKVYGLDNANSSNPIAKLNQQWPNVQGITEAQARDMCSNALKGSQLNGKCGGTGTSITNEFMEGCLADILYGGTTEFLESITSAFTSSCQLDLAKDPANYVTSPEGKNILKPEYLDDICDLECDKHGRCGQKGVCVCDRGWEGYNCHIQSGIGPQVDRIRSGPLCDLAQRPCQKIFMEVSNVDFSDDLICRVQNVDDVGNNIGRPMDTEADFLSAFRIACVLPETTVSSQVYKVSASNDGSLFGNQMSVHVFDSACLDCNETVCTEKTTACHIDNVCYRDGAKNENNPFLVCDVNNDTTDWTYKSVCNGVQVADIIFVVDASGSVRRSNFAQQLNFLSNLTQNFVLGPDDVRFGAVLFASSAQKLFDLKDHSDHSNITEAILSTVYTGGSTNTAAALNFVADQNMLDPASGGRPNATKIVIVITDGHSNSRSRTEAAVQRLKDANVQLISIGVGGNTNGDELVLIASKPENVFEVSGFDVLSHIEEQVTKQTCVPV